MAALSAQEKPVIMYEFTLTMSDEEAHCLFALLGGLTENGVNAILCKSDHWRQWNGNTATAFEQIIRKLYTALKPMKGHL